MLHSKLGDDLFYILYAQDYNNNDVDANDGLKEVLKGMKEEDMTLAQVIEELDDKNKRSNRMNEAFEKFSSTADQGQALSEIVQTYEDKIEKLKDEKEALDEKLEELMQVIGENLYKNLIRREDNEMFELAQKILLKYNTIEDGLLSMENTLEILQTHIGLGFMEDIIELDTKPDGNLRDETSNLQVLNIMSEQEITLCDAIKYYEDLINRHQGNEGESLSPYKRNEDELIVLYENERLKLIYIIGHLEEEITATREHTHVDYSQRELVEEPSVTRTVFHRGTGKTNEGFPEEEISVAFSKPDKTHNVTEGEYIRHIEPKDTEQLIEQYQHDLKRLPDKNKELHDLLTSTDGDGVEPLLRENRKFVEEKKKLELTILEQQSRINDAEKRSDALEKESKRLEKTVKEMKSDQEKIKREQIEEIASIYDDVGRDDDDIRVELHSLRDENKRFEHEMKEVQKKTKAENKNKEKYTEKVDILMKKIADLKEEVLKLKKKEKEWESVGKDKELLERQLENIQGENSKRRDERNEFEASMLREANDKNADEIDLLNRKLKDAEAHQRKSKEHYENEIEYLHDKIKEDQSDEEELRKEVHRLRGENRKISEEVRDLDKKLTEAEELYSIDVGKLVKEGTSLKLEKGRMVDDYENEMKNLKNKNEYDYDQYKEDIAKLTENITELNNGKQLLEDENEELRKKLYERRGDEILFETAQSLSQNLEHGRGLGESKKTDTADGYQKELQTSKEYKDLLKRNKELQDILSSLKLEKERLVESTEQEKSNMMREMMKAKAEVENKLMEQLQHNGEQEEIRRSLHDDLDTLKARKSQMELEFLNTRNELDSQHNLDMMKEKQKFELSEKDLQNNNEQLKRRLEYLEKQLRDANLMREEEVELVEKRCRQKEDDLKREKDDINRYHTEEKNETENNLKSMREQIADLEKQLQGIEARHLKQMDDYAQRVKVQKGEDIIREREKIIIQFEREKNDMEMTFVDSKRKVHENLENDLKRRLEENRNAHEMEIRKMRDHFERELRKLQDDFEIEREDIQANTEAEFYTKMAEEKELMETEFQEMIKKVLKEHEQDIDSVENQLKVQDKKFQSEKNKMRDDFEKDKLTLTNRLIEERKGLEKTMRELLGEIVKLKQQRNHTRHDQRKEKEIIEEAFEEERVKEKEKFEKEKRDFCDKIKEEHEEILTTERNLLQSTIDDLRRELEESEMRRKHNEIIAKKDKCELERQFQEEREDLQNKMKTETQTTKSHLEEDFQQTITDEKIKLEDTLQALRKEVHILQEQRNDVESKASNHDIQNERHVLEKSVANYKKEVLHKLEEEWAMKLLRGKTPLEEQIKDLQKENEDLRNERWKTKNAFRREKLQLEKEFENERELLEEQFRREKEDTKHKMEAKIRLDQTRSKIESRFQRPSRSTSPIKVRNMNINMSYKN